MVLFYDGFACIQKCNATWNWLLFQQGAVDVARRVYKLCLFCPVSFPQLKIPSMRHERTFEKWFTICVFSIDWFSCQINLCTPNSPFFKNQKAAMEVLPKTMLCFEFLYRLGSLWAEPYLNDLEKPITERLLTNRTCLACELQNRLRGQHRFSNFLSVINNVQSTTDVMVDPPINVCFILRSLGEGYRAWGHQKILEVTNEKCSWHWQPIWKKSSPNSWNSKMM